MSEHCLNKKTIINEPKIKPKILIKGFPLTMV